MDGLGKRGLTALWAQIRIMLGWNGTTHQISDAVVPTLPQNKIDGLSDILAAKLDKAGGIVFNNTNGSPVSIKAKRADDRASASIPFLDGNENKIGEIGVRRLSGGVNVPYFTIDNALLNTIFHEGNANKETIDWVCKILSAVNVNASGDIVANGGVVAKGISDLTMYRI